MAAAKIGIGDDEAVIAALALYDRAGNLLYLSPDRVVPKRHVIGGPGSEFSYYTTEKNVDFRLELPVLQPEMQLTVRLLFAIKELGLTEAQYGYIMGVSALISVGFVLATGYVPDRVSPLLIFMGSGVLVIFLNFFGYFMVHDYNAFFVIGILMAAVYAIQNVSTGVCLIQLFPAEKYGQFCSANASLNCIFMMFASYFGGVAIDRFGYRFIFVWDLLFNILATGVLLRVYRLWRKLAGQPEITSRRYRNVHSLSCFTKPSSASVPEALPGFRKERKRRRRSRVAPHVNQTVVTAPTSRARGRE